MNKVMDPQKSAKMMQEFERENAKMGMSEKMSKLAIMSKKQRIRLVSILYLSTGRVAQSVTCLATDACLTADPGVVSSIPARYHTFVEIDHVYGNSPPSADLFKKGCCQLQAKVFAQITG